MVSYSSSSSSYCCFNCCFSSSTASPYSAAWIFSRVVSPSSWKRRLISLRSHSGPDSITSRAYSSSSMASDMSAEGPPAAEADGRRGERAARLPLLTAERLAGGHGRARSGRHRRARRAPHPPQILLGSRPPPLHSPQAPNAVKSFKRHGRPGAPRDAGSGSPQYSPRRAPRGLPDYNSRKASRQEKVVAMEEESDLCRAARGSATARA